MKYVVVLFLGISLFGCQQKQTPLFKRLLPEETGVTFNNEIGVRDTFNILDFEYTYNGGGVATADFNGDGLADLFFTGNLVPNKLYLNKGDFKFEDVTDKSGLGGTDRWNSGVAVVDINYDGLPDLYVCATAYPQGPRRANRLFVNQGLGTDKVPTFKEMAAEYGIADTTHSTTASFFDYDNDGDLDLFVITDEMEKERQPNIFKKKVKDGTSINNDRLYRNDFNAQLGHPVFTDVTIQAGILSDGYSLGMNICDIDQDGWKDIYITNDYLTNDLLYINNHDGTFTDKAPAYFKHTCYAAMGNDVTDFNNDGLLDVVALDMLPEDNYRRKTMMLGNNYTSYLNNDKYGYQYQYVRNVLQLNQGPRPDNHQLLFSEVGMVAGIGATDWSWCPLVADFDNDGWRDLIITNGFPKDVTDHDFTEYYQEVYRYIDKMDALAKIPSVKLKNYAYRNLGASLGNDAVTGGPVTFENVGDPWGIDTPSFSNGAVYVDLDNDGDLDYVVNNINDPAFIYKNELPAKHYLKIALNGGKQNPMGVGAFLSVYSNGNKQIWEQNLTRGYLSSIDPMVHFGLGDATKIDSVVVNWQGGKRQVLRDVQADQTIKVNIADAGEAVAAYQKATKTIFQDVTSALGIDFTPSEADYVDFNLQRLLPHKLSQEGPKIAVGDVSGDGLEDFYIGGSKGQKGVFFIQKADGSFSQKDLLPNAPDKQQEEIGVCLFDADSDGDLDLYLVSGSVEVPVVSIAYQDRLFINNGGQFTLADKALPGFLKSGSCVRSADYDHDGDMDLFVGGRCLPNEYPKPASSYILKNESTAGEPHFSLVKEPLLENLGLVCDAVWADFDGDGWEDLAVAGEWMPLVFIKNEKGKFHNYTKESGLADKKGWWTSLTAADIDNDGDMDLVAGNWGLNTIVHATDQRPIRIYSADFDGNGSWDAMPAGYFPLKEGGPVEEFPYFTRLDIQKQVVKVRKFYKYHSDFGIATMEDMLTKLDKKDALKQEANYLQSAVIRNMGKGKFEAVALPLSAQTAPIYGVAVGDFTGDGKADIVAVGNDYGNEVGQGKMDAFNGIVLAGDGQGGFRAMRMAESGFLVMEDAKDLQSLRTAGGGELLIATQNRGRVHVFKKTTLK